MRAHETLVLRRTLIAALALGLLAGPLGGLGFAESYVPECQHAWWQPRHGMPSSFEGMPAQPTVLLPALWAQVEGVAPGGEVYDALTVLVKPLDSEATEPVAGELGVGVLGDLPLPGFDPSGVSMLRRQLYWRATAPLAPGTYEATLTVAEPPEGYGWECYYEAFDRKVTFQIPAEPPPAPTLAVTAKLTLSPWPWPEYGTDCEAPNVAACDDAPGVCCWYVDEEPNFYTFAAEVVPSGLAVGGPANYVLRVRTDSVEGGSPKIGYWHPVADGKAIVRSGSFRPAPYQLPWPKEPELCVEAELWNLATDTSAATTQVCVPTDSPEPVPLPPLACDAKTCGLVEVGAPVEPAEPGPEDPAEPGPEAITEPSAEPGPEPGPEADAADSSTATPDPEGSRSPGASGCTGAPGGSALLALASLAALSWRRRRGLHGRP